MYYMVESAEHTNWSSKSASWSNNSVIHKAMDAVISISISDLAFQLISLS